MKLKVKSMDGHFVGVYELEEARTWDYSDPEALLVIKGRHVRSWDELLEIVGMETNEDCDEIEVSQVNVVLGGG